MAKIASNLTESNWIAGESSPSRDVTKTAGLRMEEAGRVTQDAAFRIHRIEMYQCMQSRTGLIKRLALVAGLSGNDQGAGGKINGIITGQICVDEERSVDLAGLLRP